MKDRRRSRYVSVDELANYLSMSINTLYSWVNQRKIPYYKFGKSLRFSMDDIKNWISDKRKNNLNF